MTRHWKSRQGRQTPAGQLQGSGRARAEGGPGAERKVRPAEPECALPRLCPPELGAHVVAAMVHFSKNQLAFP